MANKWRQAFLTLFLMLIPLGPAWGFLDFLRTDPAIKQQIGDLNRQKIYEIMQANAEEEKSLAEIEYHFAQRRNEAVLRKRTQEIRQIDREEAGLKYQLMLSFKQRSDRINAKYEALIRNLKQQR